MRSKPFDLAQGKWRKLQRRVRLFRFVPFVDFVLVAGSMATGQVHEKSDFDVIVGAKHGRIFTARFFAVVLFQMRGWRRSKLDERREASDKICMNHFVTPRSYRLSPPYNSYWADLYQKVVPVLGKETAIADFFRANDWINPGRTYERHPRYLGEGKSFLKRLLELLLSGKLGDGIEKMLKKDQVKRIESGLPQALGHKPRFVYNEDELELHPDTSRIEEILKSLDRDHPHSL